MLRISAIKIRMVKMIKNHFFSSQQAPLFSVSIKAETFDENDVDDIDAEIEDPSASAFNEMEDEFEGMFR